jgi:hypothetical protein
VAMLSRRALCASGIRRLSSSERAHGGMHLGSGGVRLFSCKPLVVAEHADGALANSSLNAIGAAAQLDAQVMPAPQPVPCRGVRRSCVRVRITRASPAGACVAQVSVLVAGSASECESLAKQLADVEGVSTVRALPLHACSRHPRVPLGRS